MAGIWREGPWISVAEVLKAVTFHLNRVAVGWFDLPKSLSTYIRSSKNCAMERRREGRRSKGQDRMRPRALVWRRLPLLAKMSLTEVSGSSLP